MGWLQKFSSDMGALKNELYLFLDLFTSLKEEGGGGRTEIGRDKDIGTV